MLSHTLTGEGRGSHFFNISITDLHRRRTWKSIFVSLELQLYIRSIPTGKPVNKQNERLRCRASSQQGEIGCLCSSLTLQKLLMIPAEHPRPYKTPLTFLNLLISCHPRRPAALPYPVHPKPPTSSSQEHIPTRSSHHITSNHITPTTPIT